MKHFLSTCFIGILVLVGIQAIAEETQSIEAESHKLAEELVNIMGIPAQAQELPLTMVAVVKESQKQAPQETAVSNAFETIISGLKKHVIPSEMVTKSQYDYAHLLSLPELKEIIGWYQSPLGRRITALEMAFSKPEKQMEMMQSKSQILEKYRGTKRLELCQILNEVTATSENMVELSGNFQFVMITALSYAENPSETPDYELIRSMIALQKDNTRAAVKAHSELGMTFMYQSLSEDDLQSYIDFAKSDAGHKFIQISANSVNEYLNDSLTKMFDEIVIPKKTI